MSARPHIAILGAGPTGLEAALAASDGGFPFTVYESAPAVADHVRCWSHVRLFSPWHLDVSPRMRRHLAAAGRAVPEGGQCPTGKELLERVLTPLAELPDLAPRIRLSARVVSVGREGLLKHEEIGAPTRARKPFRLLVEGPAGEERIERADVVLDATGSYGFPNALGDGGIPAPGERALDDAIERWIPDLDAEAARWGGKTILLAGSGHSAQTAARDLAALAERHAGTRVLWVLRRRAPSWGAVADDPLPERTRLNRQAAALAGGTSAAVEARHGTSVESLEGRNGRLLVTLRDDQGGGETVAVERVLSLTGYVGDHRLYRQLQVHECYATCGPMKLAGALLAAGATDCLAGGGQGVETLVNPEPGFFILGSKSYGRNSSFLMRTGWEQVEEVFAWLAG